MAHNGSNNGVNIPPIGDDRGVDALWAALQTQGDNMNHEFQDIRNILANLSLQLVGRGAIQANNGEGNNPAAGFARRVFPQANLPPPSVSSSDSEDEDHNMNNLDRRQNYYRPKVDLPTFNGNLDVESFLEWCYEVEKCFDMMEIPEDRQAKYVAHKLRGGAAAWWEVTQNNRRRQGKALITSWTKIKRLMTARFLPPDYTQQLFQKYQRCSQGSRSVSEYTEEFYRLGARCNLSETPEQQTARYINGLRFNIREKMSLTPIWSVDEAYNMAIRAEDFLTQSNQRRTYSTPKPVTTQSPHDVTSVQTATPSSQPVLASDTGSSKNQRQKQGNDVPARNSMSNPYARPMTGKCFKCGEPGHRSNECRARKAVNLISRWKNGGRR